MTQRPDPLASQPRRSPIDQPPRRARFNGNIPDRRKEPRERPRTFLLKWNNAHQKTSGADRYIWHECWGTLYPNGKVSLDYGSPYDSMGDLRDHVSQIGVYLFQWLTEDNLTLSAPEGTALSEVHE